MSNNFFSAYSILWGKGPRRLAKATVKMETTNRAKVFIFAEKM